MQVVYAIVGLGLCALVVAVGVVAGRRMWREEQRHSELKRSQHRPHRSLPEAPEASPSPDDVPVDVDALPPPGSVGRKGRGPSTSPSLYSLGASSLILAGSMLSLPDVQLISRGESACVSVGHVSSVELGAVHASATIPLRPSPACGGRGGRRRRCGR